MTWLCTLPRCILMFAFPQVFHFNGGLTFSCAACKKLHHTTRICVCTRNNVDSWYLFRPVYKLNVIATLAFGDHVGVTNLGLCWSWSNVLHVYLRKKFMYHYILVVYLKVSLLRYEEICKGFSCKGYLIALQEILEEWRTGSKNWRFWVENLHCTKLTTNVLETIFTNTSTILALFRIDTWMKYESPISEEVLPFMVGLSSPTRESLSPLVTSFWG